MAQREELTRFLKAARGRISPVDAGLPAGERRRARGLRREEVATLAGMSVTWYTWFEQGREVKLSAAMLERLSRTLRLSAEEREFLFALAQHRPPPLALPPDAEIRPGTQHLMDSLDIPAQVINDDWTVIGWNRMVTRVFRDYAALPVEDRNLFKILMLDERYRVDPERYRVMTRQLVARFKWDYSRTTRVEVFDALIAEMLERSEAFREFWDKSEITAHFEDEHPVDFPDGRRILLHHTSYAIEQAPSQRLMLFAPVGEESAALLRAIAAED